MRIFTLFIFILLISSCSKPVYTVYFDDENHTVFTTKEIKLTTKDNRDLVLEVSKIFSVPLLARAAIIAPTIITEDIALVTDIKGVCNEGVTLQTT